MCGYFFIGFIDFMLAGKALTDFTNSFSPSNFKTNDDMILNYFKTNISMKHLIYIKIWVFHCAINNSLGETKSMKLKIILLLRLKKEN